MCVTCLKMMTTTLLQKANATLRSFITSDSVDSGDEENDESERKHSNKSARRIVQILFGTIAFETVIFLIPHPIKDKLFELPHQLLPADECSSTVLYNVYLAFLPVSVITAFFSGTVSLAVTLIKMRTKLRLLTHRVERISQQPYETMEEFFEHVNREVREVLAHHLEYLRLLKILKNSLDKMFLLVHFCAIFAVGTFFYVCKNMGINAMTAAFSTAPVFYLLEHFILCHLVDSLEDEADAIGQSLFELCARIPFQADHRLAYVQLRTSLSIMTMNVRYGMTVDCMGLFGINTPLFTKLVHVAYKVFNFMIAMG